MTEQRICNDSEHDWVYDEEETNTVVDGKPITGYIEKCRKCGILQQIPQ
jgi:hypothetical protein